MTPFIQLITASLAFGSSTIALGWAVDLARVKSKLRAIGSTPRDAAALRAAQASLKVRGAYSLPLSK